MQFFRSIGRAIRAVLTAMAILFSSAALAGTPTLTFVDGWVGEYASNANQPSPSMRPLLARCTNCGPPQGVQTHQHQARRSCTNRAN